MSNFITIAGYTEESNVRHRRKCGMNITSHYHTISHNLRKYRRKCQGCRVVRALAMPLTLPEIRLTLLIGK